MGARRCDLAYFGGLAAAIVLLVEFGFVARRVARLGTDDFSRIWGGPRAFVLGHDPYDALTWADTAARVGAPPGGPDTAVYLYPPWVVLALAPLGMLPLIPATLLWIGGGIVAAVGTMRLLLRAVLPRDAWAHGIVGFLLLGSPPAVVTLLTGQWPFWFVAALATIALLLRRARSGAAGALAAVMLAKPPLFVFLAAALAMRDLWPAASAARRGRLVLSGLLAGTILVGLSWSILPSWWPGWLREVAEVQLGIAGTLPTMFASTFGPGGAWPAAAVLIGCVLLALHFRPHSESWLPVWIALSLAGTVYSNTYDSLLLIVALVLAAGAAPTRARRAVVLVSGAVVLVAVMAYLHTLEVGIYTAAVPLLTFLLIVACLWPVRSSMVVADVPSAQ